MGILTGALMGLVVAGIVCFILLKVTKTDGKTKCRFDERQKTARGEAYKYAFWTETIGMLVYMLLLVIAPELPIRPELGILLVALLGIIVQIFSSIRMGAYFAMNEKKKALQIIFCWVGLINILFGVASLLNGAAFEDGKLGLGSGNLFAGILSLLVLWATVFLPRENTDSEDGE